MPRKPKFIHPLRKAREAMGKMSQERFAKLIGCSHATVQSIELGRMPVSPDLGQRIMAATGILPETLMNKSGEPFTISRQQFSDGLYQEWREATGVFQGDVPEKIQTEAVEIARLVEVLQVAAYRKGRLFALQYAFDEWLKKAIEDFDLKDALAKETKERGNAIECRIPIFRFETGRLNRLIKRHGRNDTVIFSRLRIGAPEKKQKTPPKKRGAK